MRVFKGLLGAAAALIISVGMAQAASYQYFHSSGADFTTDLSKATAATGDDHVPATSPFITPDGFNLTDDFHFDRTYTGATKGESFDDVIYFDVNTFPGVGGSGNGAVSIHLAGGANNLIDTAVFTLFLDTDGDDSAVGETAITTVTATSSDNNKTLNFGPLNTTFKYILTVAGTIDSGANNGNYDVSIAFVPVPPAVLLLLTGIGALFGFARIRRSAA